MNTIPNYTPHCCRESQMCHKIRAKYNINAVHSIHLSISETIPSLNTNSQLSLRWMTVNSSFQNKWRYGGWAAFIVSLFTLSSKLHTTLLANFNYLTEQAHLICRALFKTKVRNCEKVNWEINETENTIYKTRRNKCITHNLSYKIKCNSNMWIDLVSLRHYMRLFQSWGATTAKAQSPLVFL